MRASRIIGIGTGALLAWSASVALPARALEIVLNDVASDRVERQRAFVRGELPLAATPALDKLEDRLKARNLAVGRAIYIRIFKETSELELWMQNASGTFTLLDTYPICHWTGSIGPKLQEGDKQSPEGFYSVGYPQTRLVGRWRKAFNLGFPNRHDQLLERTGSYILIHGGCSSVGCFAMTNAVQDEIYMLAQAALKSGQQRFPVHIFPFRMTKENLARHAGHPWSHTWADLKPGYDSFERTRIPPRVVLCGVRYQIADGLPGETGNDERRTPVLRVPADQSTSRDRSVVTDADGYWAPPTCQIADAEERRAVHATSSAASLSVSDEGTSDDATEAAAQSSAQARAEPTRLRGRVAVPRLPLRRARAAQNSAQDTRDRGSQKDAAPRDKVPKEAGGI